MLLLAIALASAGPVVFVGYSRPEFDVSSIPHFPASYIVASCAEVMEPALGQPSELPRPPSVIGSIRRELRSAARRYDPGPSLPGA